MTAEQYWLEDPWFVEAYRQAETIRIERENQKLWLQGLYIYDAFSVVLSNAFAKKGSKQQKYLEKPIRITPKSKAEQKRDAEAERKKLAASLTAWGNAWNNLKQKQGG